MPTQTAGSPDWAAALDIKKALSNCRNDIVGDWYRDPWGWPELNWVVGKGPEFIIARLNSAGVRRAAKLDVAKENFAVRPAIVMDPIDRLIYQALVDRFSADLIGDLPEWVYGWRLPPHELEAGCYARNDYQYENFRNHLSELADTYDAALKTDVVSCFASIPVERIIERIVDTVGNSRMTGRLTDLLEGWDSVVGRAGLPQRSSASAVIANMYLTGVDDVLRRFNRNPPRLVGGRVARWMDDVWLFGDDAGRLRTAQLQLQAAMGEMGLYMNLGKTDVLEGPEVQEEVLRLQHSAVDGGLHAIPQRLEPLHELVEEVLARPEHADRTTIKFVGKRMRDHEVFERAQDFIDAAPRMPQGADALARVFRDAEIWRDLQDWFVHEYARSSWGAIEWGVAQLGTMFPSSEKQPPVLREFLGSALEASSRDLPMTALAAHRLTHWERNGARQLLQDAAAESDHPLIRRILALALVRLRAERAVVRRILGEFEENRVTLAMLEDTNFRSPPVTADFEGH